MPIGSEAPAESPADIDRQLLDAFRHRDKATQAYNAAAKAWHGTKAARDKADESLASCLERAKGEQANFVGIYSATLRWSEPSGQWVHSPVGPRQLPPGQYGIGSVLYTPEGSRVHLVGENPELWYEADVQSLKLVSGMDSNGS
jgi:hypothetical protein